MDRRDFLSRSVRLVAAAGTVSYFDLGASWVKHDQIFMPETFVLLNERLVAINQWADAQRLFGHLEGAERLLRLYHTDRRLPFPPSLWAVRRPTDVRRLTDA